MKPDIFELVALVASILGVACSVWAVTQTYQKLRLIQRMSLNGDLQAKAVQRLVRHMLNLLAQLTLLYVAFVAFYFPPVSDSFQIVVSRVGQTFVSTVLAIKVFIDRWYELNIEWSGQERRRKIDE